MPLLSVDIYTKIKGKQAFTSIEQVFLTGSISEISNQTKNINNHSWSSYFVLPIQENTKITGFEVIYDDKTLVSKVENTNIAEKQYNQNLNEGKTSAILKQSSKISSNIFSMQVGHLPADTKIKIKIDFIQNLQIRNEIQNDKNEIEKYIFQLPSVITSKYIKLQKENKLKNIFHSNEQEILKLSHEIEWFYVPNDQKLVKVYSASHDKIIEMYSSKKLFYETENENYQTRDFILTLLFEKNNNNQFDYQFNIENNPILKHSIDDQGFAIDLMIPVSLNSSVLSLSFKESHFITFAIDISSSMKNNFYLVKENFLFLLQELLEKKNSFDIEFTLCIIRTDTQCWYLGPLHSNLQIQIINFINSIIPYGTSNLLPFLEKIDDFHDSNDILYFTDGIFTDFKFISENLENFNIKKHRFFPIVFGSSIETKILDEICLLSNGRIEILTPITEKNLEKNQNIFQSNDNNHCLTSSNLNDEFLFSFSNQISAIFSVKIDRVDINWFCFSNLGSHIVNDQKVLEKRNSLFDGDKLHIYRIFPPLMKIFQYWIKIFLLLFLLILQEMIMMRIKIICIKFIINKFLLI